MPFQKGRQKTGGRGKGFKTQVKDFIKEHPYAVETLMLTLYEQGVKGDREAAMYIIDRIKGKPKVQAEITGAEGEALGAGLILKLFQLIDERNRLQEGQYALQGQAERQGLPQGLNEEEA